MKEHWCPVCDQGWVDRVIIPAPGLSGYLCNECEAFWDVTQPIEKENFVQLSAVAPNLFNPSSTL